MIWSEFFMFSGGTDTWSISEVCRGPRRKVVVNVPGSAIPVRGVSEMGPENRPTWRGFGWIEDKCQNGFAERDVKSVKLLSEPPSRVTMRWIVRVEAGTSRFFTLGNLLMKLGPGALPGPLVPLLEGIRISGLGGKSEILGRTSFVCGGVSLGCWSQSAWTQAWSPRPWESIH